MKYQSNRFVVVLLMAVALIQTVHAAEPVTPTVVFYEIPGCPICKKINGWLDIISQKHPGKAQIVRKSSMDEANQAEIAARGIEHHGVVILNTNGNVDWRMDAHMLTDEILTGAFNQYVLALPPVTPSQQDEPGTKALPSPTNKNLAVDVANMTCDGCASAITASLTKLKGVHMTDITFGKNGGIVSYDPDQLTESDILEAIRKAGYQVSVKATESK